MLEHAGHLHHAMQLHLAPAAAHRRLAQRLDEVGGLPAQQRHVRLDQAAQLIAERRIGGDAALLHGAEHPIDPLQRLAQRLHQRIDRLLARLQLPARRSWKRSSVAVASCRKL